MKRSTDRSVLFLTELVLDLLLFALCAAVCAALLAHARSMSRESGRLTEAVYAAQTAAEDWKAAGALPTRRGADENGLLCSFNVRGNVLDITITGEDGAVVYALEGVTRLE